MCRSANPRKVSKEQTFLAPDQLHALAKEAGPHRTMVWVLGYTGLRWGAIIGLRVRDRDLTRRRLNVSQNAVEVGSTIHVDTPKTHERRFVPYPAFLHELLIMQSQDKLPDALLFPGPDGLYHASDPNRRQEGRLIRRCSPPCWYFARHAT